MEKYYWNPSREDRIGVCFGIFKDDNLTRGDVEYIVDTFPGQSIDFFGALRARVYDSAVREFIESKGLEGLGKGVLVSNREGFEFPAPSMDLVRRVHVLSYGPACCGEAGLCERLCDSVAHHVTQRIENYSPGAPS